MAPPHKTMAAGPFARTESPRKDPNKISASHGDSQHAGEGHISRSGVREADHPHGRRQQEQDPSRGVGSIEAQREPRGSTRGKERRNRAWEARSPFADPKPLEAKASCPIKKRRLFEPWFAIKAWGNPVVGLHHVARDPPIAWLVGTNKSNYTEVAEITNVERENDEYRPRNPCGSAGSACFPGLGRGLFSHRKMSLTSKLFLHRQTSCILSRNGFPVPFGLAMKEWLEYTAVWLVLKALGLLPRSMARGLAYGFVRLFYSLLPRLRKTTEINLRIAFTEWSEALRQSVIRGMLRNLGWMAAEFARFPKLSKENIDRVVVMDGLENFLEGQRRGKGVLFLTEHLDAW